MPMTPEARKRYNEKTKRYAVHFSLSAEDKNTVELFEQLLAESGLTPNAYLKKLITDHVNEKFYH